MKVVISVPGVFHAFHLGRQLQQREALRKIYTSFPRFALDTTGIPRSKVHPIRRSELIMQVGDRLPALKSLVPTASQRPFVEWKNRVLDRNVARKLRISDNVLFIGFAGCSLQSIQRANELGFTTVIERSSSHARTQASILDHEYQKNGLDRCIPEAWVERGEREYEAADYVATPSTFAYQSFLKHGFDEQKLLCVPFGTDIPESNREESDDMDDTFHFLFSGHLNLRKGIQYLLKAWDRLSINATLILTSGIDEDIRPLIEGYEDDDSIQYIGYVDDLDTWYNRADAFVFPSLEEGSARVTYEAMAHGLPLITTFNSGWVGEDGVHGIEVPIRDPEALATAMRRLYQNPKERKQMSSASRALIGENYTWDDYGRRIYHTYKSLLD